MDKKGVLSKYLEDMSVSDLLFLAKEKLQETKIKHEQHCLGYIDEAIKWARYGKI